MRAEKGKPWNYDEDNRKFVLPKHTKFDPNFLPVIQNLTAMGLTESDIGVIVGYQGEHTNDWLNNLKLIHPEVKDAAAIGKYIADSFLVAQMYKSAVGYDYVTQKFKKDKETGEMELVEESIQHQPANAQLAMFVASNRMPDQFKHRIDLTRKGFIIDASEPISSEQIEKLAGKLLEEAQNVKQIESTVIETTFMETDNVESQ
jgi:hypothetical protein